MTSNNNADQTNKKNSKMKSVSTIILMTLIGAIAGIAGSYFYFSSLMGSNTSQVKTQSISSDKAPLYWVAPMDAKYKRDKPGKSPMGMDLIPVYDDAGSGKNPAGTVTISPAVENNLGVKTAQVSKAKLSPNIETVGYIAFDESRLWQTNVRVTGWVQKLNINAVGEKVTKGDVLFTLYSPELIKAQEELLNAYRTGRKGLIRGATERLVTLGVDRVQIADIVRHGKAENSVDVKAVNRA